MKEKKYVTVIFKLKTKNMTIVIALLLFCPLSLLFFFKSSRVIFPELVGLHCINKRICIDDQTKYWQAKKLLENAKSNVELKLSPIAEKTRIIFCVKQSCFKRFGFDRQAALSLSDYAIVVSPRGWTPYYLQHELIHIWQYQCLGIISYWTSSYKIKEGMAYGMSDDPRNKLTEPFESYRHEFNIKYRNGLEESNSPCQYYRTIVQENK